MATNETLKGLKPRGRHAPAASSRGADGTVASPTKDAALDPQRTCVLSGRQGSRADLIRLALGPDGTVAPDVRARAGGRGAWIAVDRVALETAIAKGRLKRALARAFRTATILIPADLPEQIEAALRRATLDRLGLEARAGTLLTGSERIAEAARKGSVSLLLHARDAAADGTRKLDQALRVGLGIEGSGDQGVVIPASRAILSMALGRENVVHIALIAPAAAGRVAHALSRWRGFIGRNDLETGEGASPCGTDSQGESAQQHDDVKGSDTQ